MALFASRRFSPPPELVLALRASPDRAAICRQDYGHSRNRAAGGRRFARQILRLTNSRRGCAGDACFRA